MLSDGPCSTWISRRTVFGFHSGLDELGVLALGQRLSFTTDPDTRDRTLECNLGLTAHVRAILGDPFGNVCNTLVVVHSLWHLESRQVVGSTGHVLCVLLRENTQQHVGLAICFLAGGVVLRKLLETSSWSFFMRQRQACCCLAASALAFATATFASVTTPSSLVTSVVAFVTRA